MKIKMIARTTSGVRAHWAIILVLLLAGVIYLPTIGTSLHGDDYFAFVDISTKPFPRFISDVVFFRDSNVAWRPLEQVYDYALYQVFGLYGPAYHFGNFLVFELTLAALYWLCLAWGFGRYVAAGAAAILGIYPSHVITVIWVTNGGRMFAVLLFLTGLLLLIHAVRAGSRTREAAAYGLFVVAFLSDETMVALAPVALLSAFVFDAGDGRWMRAAARSALSLTPALLIGLPQVLLAPKGATGQVAMSASIPEHFWGLAGRMTDATGPVLMRDLAETQWVLGAMTIAGLSLVLILGSSRSKVLVAWTFAALAPFALTLPVTPGRYIYPAAVPFAMIIARLLGSSISASLPVITRPLKGLARGPVLQAAGAAAFVAVVLAGALEFGPVTRHKNARFAADAERYHTLAVELRRALPSVEPGTTLVIYYGTWDEPYGFVSAVARTVYRDRTIKVVNIPRGQVDQGRRVYAKERRLFNTDHGLIAASQDILQAR